MDPALLAATHLHIYCRCMDGAAITGKKQISYAYKPEFSNRQMCHRARCDGIDVRLRLLVTIAVSRPHPFHALIPHLLRAVSGCGVQRGACLKLFATSVRATPLVQFGTVPILSTLPSLIMQFGKARCFHPFTLYPCTPSLLHAVPGHGVRCRHARDL